MSGPSLTSSPTGRATCPMFENFFPSEVVARFTDRSCDFILPEGARGLLPAQREFLSGKLNIAPEKVFTIRQVHDNKVLNIKKSDLPQKGELPQADGVITNVPGIVLTVRTADCLPVFLYDPAKRAIGLVHAGWRSTAEKIVEFAVKAMTDSFGSHSPDLRVAFGPAIRSCCYEVGEEFKDVFPKEVTHHRGKYYFDLILANRHQLMAMGVRDGNIIDSQKCTMCDTKFYSFRRDGQKAGRHLSIMYLK